jgi:hypothetical protein
MNTRDPPFAASCTPFPDSVSYSCCTMEDAMLQQAMESQSDQLWPSPVAASCIVFLLPGSQLMFIILFQPPANSISCCHANYLISKQQPCFHMRLANMNYF